MSVLSAGGSRRDTTQIGSVISCPCVSDDGRPRSRMLQSLDSLSPREYACEVWSKEVLGDPRRVKRCGRVFDWMLTRLREEPVGRQRSERRGLQRFLDNKRVVTRSLWKKLKEHSLKHLLSLTEVFCAHDSCEIDEHGRNCPSDAGSLRSSKASGYLTHWSVCIHPEGFVIGALDADAWTRAGNAPVEDHHKRPMSEKESRKWDRGVNRTERLLKKAGFRGEVFHAEDKEADIFEHLCNQADLKRNVVVRVDPTDKRYVKVEGGKLPLLDVVATWPVEDTREKTVVFQKRDLRLGLQAKPRKVQLELRFGEVLVLAPRWYRGEHKCGRELWVVDVREVDAPAGVKPLHWVLWCTSPVRTLARARKVVQVYEARWGAEEYFFACKTGCELEELTVDDITDFRRLQVVVAAAANLLVGAVVAARTTPTAPASNHIDEATQDAIKDAAAFHRIKIKPGRWTLGKFLLVLAQMGGYELRPDRPYGWRVLWKGWARVQEHRRIVEDYLERHGDGRKRTGGPGATRATGPN